MINNNEYGEHSVLAKNFYNLQTEMISMPIFLTVVQMVLSYFMCSNIDATLEIALYEFIFLGVMVCASIFLLILLIYNYNYLIKNKLSKKRPRAYRKLIILNIVSLVINIAALVVSLIVIY